MGTFVNEYRASHPVVLSPLAGWLPCLGLAEELGSVSQPPFCPGCGLSSLWLVPRPVLLPHKWAAVRAEADRVDVRVLTAAACGTP